MGVQDLGQQVCGLVEDGSQQQRLADARLALDQQQPAVARRRRGPGLTLEQPAAARADRGPTGTT
jgi:hypothetical protein